MNQSPQNLPGITIEDVRSAAENIARYAHRTPVITCRTLDKLSGHNLYFKCENLQKTGAFKFRGAINALANLSDQQRERGVVTHSSGNHAQALAAAAAIFSVDAHIVMPSNSSEVKKAGVNGYGGRIIECRPTLDSRIETANRVQSETGATMIPPFDHPDVIAGQGTCALEMFDQVESNLDFVIAPVGGGGLISGTCISTSAYGPDCKVIAAEPVNANDAFQSKQSGKLVPQTNPNTKADGLRTSLGALTWPFVREVVSRVDLVTEQEMIEAMRLFLERTKMLIETSAAVAVATALWHLEKDRHSDRPLEVGIVLSGGNVDLSDLPW